MKISIAMGVTAIRSAEVQLNPNAVTMGGIEIRLERKGEGKRDSRLVMSCGRTVLEEISSFHAMPIMEMLSPLDEHFVVLNGKLDKVLEALTPTILFHGPATGPRAIPPPPLVVPRTDACPHCGFHAGHRAL